MSESKTKALHLRPLALFGPRLFQPVALLYTFIYTHSLPHSTPPWPSLPPLSLPCLASLQPCTTLTPNTTRDQVPIATTPYNYQSLTPAHRHLLQVILIAHLITPLHHQLLLLALCPPCRPILISPSRLPPARGQPKENYTHTSRARRLQTLNSINC